MKQTIKYLFSIIAFSTVGCSDFASTDINPNGSTKPLTSALLTNAISSFGGAGASTNAVTCGLYAQYFAQTLYTDVSRYSTVDANWTELSGGIYDLQNIININTDPGTKDYALLSGSNNDQIAIARILKAIRFSYLTDRYGDMPYSEALKGLASPKYDKQEDIYTDLFKELAEAVSQFDDILPPKGDILFGDPNDSYRSDISRWKQYANSWRMILALRISKVNPAKAKAEFLAAFNDTNGYLMNTSDDVFITYPGNATEFYNPWFGLAGDQNICTTISDSLNINSDPRKNAFGNPSSGTLVGFAYGLDRDAALTYAANNPAHSLILNNAFRAQSSKLKLLTSADISLARAEAALLGWTSEDYKQLYADGIMQSMQYWGVYSSSAYDSYMSLAQIDINSAKGSPTYKIGVQRWLSFYPDGPQGWAEWRRTGYPILTPAPLPNNSASGLIPVRFVYPSVEYGNNTSNVKAAAAELENGKDSQDSHVWWDK